MPHRFQNALLLLERHFGKSRLKINRALRITECNSNLMIRPQSMKERRSLRATLKVSQYYFKAEFLS